MNFILIGGLSAALAVACGAFGAHGLAKVASPERLGWWETAARYHLATALATVLMVLSFTLLLVINRLQARMGPGREAL